MTWAVASPYFETAHDKWISDAVRTSKHRFMLVPRVGAERNWHQAPAKADLGEWLNRYRQARSALHEGEGVITVFPQLAAAAGLHKRMTGSDQPLVAWLFNTEGLASATKRGGGRVALSPVDRFIVHSRREIEGYSKVLQVEADRFEFVPLQYGAKVETEPPLPEQEPYIFATGSGCRDYETFFAAVDRLGYRTLVLASDRVLAGLEVPENVTIMDQIPRHMIRRYVRHARVNVVPLTDQGTTAGLVTIVETFRHGRSLVITSRHGIDDYIYDGKNALTSRLYDPVSMAEAIEAMWTNDELRHTLDGHALDFADANCTDEAAGRSLVRVLDRFV